MQVDRPRFRIHLWTFPLPGLRDRPEDVEPNLTYELDQWAHRSGVRGSEGSSEVA